MNNPPLATSDWVVPNNLNLNPGNDDKGYFSFLSNQSLSENGVSFTGDVLSGDFGGGQLSGNLRETQRKKILHFDRSLIVYYKEIVFV